MILVIWVQSSGSKRQYPFFYKWKVWDFTDIELPNSHSERACHHELYLPRAHTPPVAHSATWYVTRFIFRSTVVLATHDDETTTSESLNCDEEAEEDGEASGEAGDQTPAPPTYEAASQNA